MFDVIAIKPRSYKLIWAGEVQGAAEYLAFERHSLRLMAMYIKRVSWFRFSHRFHQ